MTLRTRLLLFFQGALAVVLVGFSATLYLLASKHLHRQADERLEAALNTLAAAAEINDRGVEWEPAERSLSFGRRAVEGGFLWRVDDDRGRKIDGSASPDADRLLNARGPAARRAVDVTDRASGPWRILHRRLQASPPRGRSPDPPEPPAADARAFPAVGLTAAVSLTGLRETLRNLFLVLLGLSVGLWALSLAVGGRLCRHALRPLARMAEAAHDVRGDDLGRRLPLPNTSDELEELGRSFNAMLERLHESFERQRRFTGDASHQLRTPLTVMIGQVELALRQRRDVGEYDRVLTLVRRQAGRMRRIVEALLFLARADAEALRPDLGAVDLSAWLEDHVRSAPDPERAADLRLEIGPGGPHLVLADETLLRELVDNLLDNAFKYSTPGTPVDVRVWRDGPCVCLAVEDHGIGLAGADLPHIFEPFFRSPHARGLAKGGVGLGLAVALRLARAMGGEIGVDGRAGVGSTFTLRLPAVPEAVERPASTLAEAPEYR